MNYSPVPPCDDAWAPRLQGEARTLAEHPAHGPRRTRHGRRRVTPRLVDSVSQAARTLGVSELTIRRHIKLGTVPAVQIGGTWRIPIGEGDRVAQLPEECTIHEVANSFNVSELTVRRWIHGGHFPAAKRGRTWVVLRSDIEGILASSSAPQGARNMTDAAMGVPQAQLA